MLAISVYEALRDAIAQARSSALHAPGDGRTTVQLTAPATAENVLQALQLKSHNRHSG
jgi:xanthine dehydrogenase large subunit